jgi:hypothetical protein
VPLREKSIGRPRIRRVRAQPVDAPEPFFPMFNKIPFVYQEALRTIAGVKTGLLFDKPLMDFPSQPLFVAYQWNRSRSD